MSASSKPMYRRQFRPGLRAARSFVPWINPSRPARNSVMGMHLSARGYILKVLIVIPLIENRCFVCYLDLSPFDNFPCELAVKTVHKRFKTSPY